MAISQTDLDNWFSYHSPTPEQQTHYVAIRDAAKAFAAVLIEHSPSSADQTAAVRFIRQAVMTANQSIACGGK